MNEELKISREKLVPLALLYASGHDIKGKTRLQKLAFLLDREELGNDFKAYNFRKYDYGPFSKHLLQDAEELERDGVIEINKTRTFSGNARYDYELEKNWLGDIEDLAEEEDIREIFGAAEMLVEKHKEKSIRDLVEYIYDKYPEYEKNSVYEY